MSPSVPVSWGEVIDKITILEIKSAKLNSEAALKNVRHELETLSKVAAATLSGNPKVAGLKTALKHVNETLWGIEDDIRAKEAAKSFDAEFIALARAVYHNNDERGRLKREINTLLNSDISEEKQYAKY
jgi:predicted phage-related endonuclease